MNTRYCGSVQLIGLSLLSATFLQAEQIVNVGDTFVCHFFDAGDSYGSTKSLSDWTQDQIDSAIRALTTWDNAILNTPGRSVTIGLYWNSIGTGTLASANSSTPYSYYSGTTTTQHVNTYVEKVWRDGSLTTSSSYDVTIICNTSAQFYYGSEILSTYTTQYDFQSVLTHEFGHAVGFTSWSKSDGTFTTYNPNSSTSITLYTTFDSLMTNAEGKRIVEGLTAGTQVFSAGESLSLDGTDLYVYNPSTWSSGSSMSHVEAYSDPNAVMQYSLSNGEFRRDISSQELVLLKAMGWDVIPEPGTATLALCTSVGVLLRRRTLR